jgi:CRP-like cAMP-binding protein
MAELDPFVLRRAMWLRHVRWLSAAELPDLALLAENLTEVHFAAGELVSAAGVMPCALHFVIHGELGIDGRRWGPGSVVSALEVFARRPLAHSLLAIEDTRTLQLTSSDLFEILEDNFAILRAALRGFADSMPPPPPVIALPPLGTPLGFVERLSLLRDQPTFAGARLDALAELAHASQELWFAEGTPIVRIGDPAASSFIILDGSVMGPQGLLGPGHTIGAFETLAERPYRATVEARTPVRALENSANAIFDVLEDHTDLGMAMLASFATTMSELYA